MKRILIVDDEPVNLELLKEILRNENAQIATASSGKDALAYVEHNPVDLVISDLVMPGIRGTDLFFQLRKKQPFLQVIMVTAFPSFEDIVQMLEAGASDFVVKPVQSDLLIRIVNQVFAKIDRWRNLPREFVDSRRRNK